jgi:glutaredoxin
VTKPDCHLCDTARDVVAQVVAELADGASAPSVDVREFSILDDAALAEEYAEEVPVVLIDGRVHTVWRVDPARLRAALR